jgi:hypothetical protein
MADQPSPNGPHPPGDAPHDPALLLPPRPAEAGRQAARAASLRRVVIGATPAPDRTLPAMAPPAAGSLPPAAMAGSPPGVRRALTPRSLGLALAGVLTLIVLGLAVWTVAEQADPNYGVGPLLELPDQGHTHIAPGQPHPPYNSNPATSGWHREEWAPAHVMTTSIASEVSVHLLEHGSVAIFYDCAASGDCATLQRQLTDLVQKQLAARNGDGLYLFPQALPDHHLIALASWMHLQYLDRFRADVIEQFITTFIGAVKE